MKKVNSNIKKRVENKKMKKIKKVKKSPFSASKRKELQTILPILNQVANGSQKDFKSLLDNVNIPTLKLILECVYNAVYNISLHNNEMKENLKTKLEGKQKNLKHILSKSSSFKKKRQFCTSNRDCVQSLITSVLPILNSSIN